MRVFHVMITVEDLEALRIETGRRLRCLLCLPTVRRTAHLAHFLFFFQKDHSPAAAHSSCYFSFPFLLIVLLYLFQRSRWAFHVIHSLTLHHPNHPASLSGGLSAAHASLRRCLLCCVCSLRCRIGAGSVQRTRLSGDALLCCVCSLRCAIGAG